LYLRANTIGVHPHRGFETVTIASNGPFVMNTNAEIKKAQRHKGVKAQR